MVLHCIRQIWHYKACPLTQTSICRYMQSEINHNNAWMHLHAAAVLIWRSAPTCRHCFHLCLHQSPAHITTPSSPPVLSQATLERTHQALEEEKRRTVDLLYSIFPGDVAQKLWQGQPVPARKFDDVTMLFSDIVGFTAVCAQCTPMQVISMLNELYTRFDYQCGILDVYKVSRQKDAHIFFKCWSNTKWNTMLQQEIIHWILNSEPVGRQLWDCLGCIVLCRIRSLVSRKSELFFPKVFNHCWLWTFKSRSAPKQSGRRKKRGIVVERAKERTERDRAITWVWV